MAVVIDGFTEEIEAAYPRAFPQAAPADRARLLCCGRLALKTLAQTDGPYHDIEHTIIVAQVGQR